MSNKKRSRTDLTEKQQSYVEVIAELQTEHAHAHVSCIAEELGVSKPSVVQMLDRLLALGVVQRQHHEVVLTEEGHRLADKLTSRHAVLREFMVEHLGMSKRAADADACRIEHVVSDTFVTQLRLLCRNPHARGYTGIKDEPVEPIVALADKALDAESADHMMEKLSAHMAHAVREKFNKALAAAKNKDKTVAAGREYVEAYVIYMHYVEGIHAAIMSAGGHQHAGTSERAAAHENHKD